MKPLPYGNFTSTVLFRKESCLLLICFGLVIKVALFPVQTGDYTHYLAPWLHFIQTHGYAASLKFDFYNYTPAYIYLLIGIAKVGVYPLYAVKIVSILFEYLMAYYIGKTAYLKYRNNNVLWISLAIVPLLPTVLLNSSYLAQCDAVYATFVVGSIYYALREKQFLSLLFLGIAFSFKLQTALLLPFYFVMLLKGNIRWYYFLLVPAVFVLSILPAWLYGRSFTGLLSVYLQQAGEFRYLTLNFPNIYTWISNEYYTSVSVAGTIITVLFTVATGWWLSRKSITFTFESWVRLAFLSAMVVPFLLPGMHERYMYTADVLGVLYYMVICKNIHLPVGVVLISTYSYIRCSRYHDILPAEPAFFVYLLVIIFTSVDFAVGLKTQST